MIGVRVRLQTDSQIIHQRLGRNFHPPPAGIKRRAENAVPAVTATPALPAALPLIPANGQEKVVLSLHPFLDKTVQTSILL